MRHRHSSLLGRNWKVLCANWVFTAICWLLLTVGGQGQVYRFKTYTSSAGLPSNAIYHLYQDQKGYLWFSTGSGACRYDGVNYVVKSVEQGLADPSIRSVFEDHQGQFWIATQGGVNCITGDITRTFRVESGLGSNETYAGLCTRDGTVWIATAAGISRFDGQRFLSYGAGKLPPGRVWTLYEDRAGVLWIGIRGGGFVKAERLTGQAYPDDLTLTAWGREQGLPDANVFDFAEDPTHGMWIATSGGLCLFDGQKMKLYSKEQGLTSPLVSSVLVDRHGRVWCGTFGGGLFRLENDRFINFNDINGLPSNYLTTLLEDGEGNLWCGTLLNGVFRFSSELFASYNTTGLTRGMVTGVGEASDGTLWVASMTTGLSSLSPSGEMRRYTSKDGILEENNLWCLLVDRRDRVWVGGYQGVSCFDGQQFVQFPREKMGAQDRITAIGEDRQGHIWFGSATSTSNGVVRYDGQTFQRFTDQDGLSSNQVSGIRLDQKGDIWFCTENGLTRYDGQRFQAFTQKDGLPSRRVRTLYQDRDGTYWVGTTDGLCRFDGTRVTQIFKEKEGLPGSLIRTIQRFDKNLWIGTQRGIAEFDGQQVVRVYSVRDGLVNDEIINNACLQRRDGSVWFGTTEGVVRYRVAQDIARPMPPKVHLTGIRVTGAGAPNLVAPGNTQSAPLPTLDYDQNSLTFEFLGLTFLDETAVRYTYRLEPFEREWSAPSPERTARFTNLPPGRYRFAIKACSVRETWSEPQYFEITIRPPFWQTWWFRALSVVLLGTIISALYTWRIHALNQRQQQKLEHLRQLQEQRMMVMRQLLESIQVINSQLETTAVLQNIAEESARLVDGKPGGIGLVQDDRVVFKRQWVNGSWQAGDVSFQFGEGTPGKVAMSAKAIIVNDPDDEPVSFVPEQVRKNTSDGWMDVPILTRAGEVAAVLDIRHRPGRPPFTNEDISLIESLASQAAVAIENASLYGELEEKNLMIAESFRELERLYQQEQEVSRTLQELNQMKTNFIVVTSHEMRTPLTVIRGYNEALLGEFFGELNPMQHKSLSVTQRMIDRMVNSFNDILEMLKINEGQFTLKREPANLKDLVQAVLEELQPFVEKRKQTLTIVGPDVMAAVDRDKFGLVLLNVVQNAIKFTQDNGTIQISLEREGESAHIRVTDSGIGIDASELERIFDKFYTTPDPSTHSSGRYEFSARGTGLGLAIAKSYVDAHGGQIWAESKGKGEGSTLHLMIPLMPVGIQSSGAAHPQTIGSVPPA